MLGHTDDMHTALKVTQDIVGDDYSEFLRIASEHLSTFMLVWRDQFSFEPTALAIRRELQPLQLRRRRSSRWPGNVMIGHEGEVITFRFDKSALPVLERPGTLFGWLQPTYPEDLAFFGKDERCAFASASHEKDAWVLDAEFARLLPKRIELSEESIDEKVWREFFDHMA